MAPSAESQPAASSEPAAIASGAAWLRLSAFACLALFAVLGVAVLCRALPDRPREPFDRQRLNELTALQPEFVLLGNSMVGTRFEENALRRLLRPRRIAVLGLAGSRSATWYLALKNLVIASGARPRVIQFFRDTELTEPRVHALGADHVRLEVVSAEDDALVEGKLTPPLLEPVSWLAWQLDRVIPARRLRGESAGVAEAFGLFTSNVFWQGVDESARKHQINQLFAIAQLRGAAEPTDAGIEAAIPRFSEVLAASLLPDFCSLAEAHGISLSFVRVRTRTAAEGERESASSRRYVGELEQYVRKRGAEFYDMHDASWERAGLFGSGDHIDGRFRRRYTALFVEHMAQIFH
ncbi:MAG: hypothetical protein ABW061_25800 [Polyangiaceae bacterium]